MIETEQAILSVSELTLTARDLIESNLGNVWVMGEISNLSRPSSGHLYFSIKDHSAQVRCALFRMTQQRIPFTIENGQQILIQARASLYESRGDFQLIVQRLQLAGAGALQIAFENLKKRLQAEGLFDESVKKPLPEQPQQIGVVTSSSGAAIRDILSVLKRRFASIPVIIYPTFVQGDQAATNIVNAIEIANQRKECDVIIVSRGGGSLEDLWPFNEEIVARAIHASNIPIVSGVGHEVDITIADFVADQRAATPSAAAELVSPDQSKSRQQLKNYYSTLEKYVSYTLNKYQMQLSHLKERLRHPGERLKQHAQQLDQLEQHLHLAMKNRLQRAQTQLSSYSRALNAVSPLNTLARGFAIITDLKTGAVICDADTVKKDDVIHARLAKGELTCLIKK